MITPLFILWTVLLASVKSWNMTYFSPAHLSHIVMVFDLLRYSDIEGQRPYTLHSLCCKVILSPTIYFTLASSALMLFREEVWMSYNTKYMVASAWLVQPVLLNRLHIFLWQLRLKFPFVCNYFTNVVSLLRMQMWASKSFPYLPKVWVIFKETSVHLDREHSSYLKCSHHACVFV